MAAAFVPLSARAGREQSVASTKTPTPARGLCQITVSCLIATLPGGPNLDQPASCHSGANCCLSTERPRRVKTVAIVAIQCSETLASCWRDGVVGHQREADVRDGCGSEAQLSCRLTAGGKTERIPLCRVTALSWRPALAACEKKSRPPRRTSCCSAHLPLDQQ